MDPGVEHTARSFLRRSARAYEAVVARLLRLEARGDDEVTLRWLRFAAGIAWAAHPGRFADERLEAVGLRIGRRLHPSEVQSSPVGGDPRRRVLHVATTIYEIGGHTRLIENWIKKDEAAAHSLILTDQRQFKIRDDLAARIAASGGALLRLPPQRPLLDKARQLRRIAQSGYDVIVLHHHPSDVVPLVALAPEYGPPVALMNHADHVFWLGGSVADAVIDFRAFGARLSRDRRGVRQTLMFPLPLDVTQPTLNRDEARTALGIAHERVMLLSMGSAYKYKPTRKHDFFQTLHKVLAANPLAHLYVIGVSPAELHSFGVPAHDRVHVLGPLTDPSAYEAAADLYLEGFPLNSFTALLETAVRGVCPVLMYAPTPQLDLADDPSLQGLVAGAADEAAYVAQVTALIEDPAHRIMLGKAVAARIAAVNGGDAGRLYLQPIYEWLRTITHRPMLPAAGINAELAEDLDLAALDGARSTSVVLSRSADAMSGMTTIELLQVLAMSLRIGDTRLRPSHVKTWLSLARQRTAGLWHSIGLQR